MTTETATLWTFARDVARLLAPVHAQDVVAEHLTTSDLPDLLEALRERVAPVGGVDVELADHTCPRCAWTGPDGALEEKMSGRLCPECRLVIAYPKGRLTLPVTVSEEDTPPEPDLSALLVPGWEMPEAPEEGWTPTVFFDDIDGCWGSAQWMDENGQGVSIEHDIPWPFLPGVTVTADMLRALGFVVEEG